MNTGPVVAGDPAPGQRLVTGDAVNVAARLEQAAGPHEVLLGDLTYRLVSGAIDAEPVEPLELKGKSRRVPAYRLLGLRATAAGRPVRETAMVGRVEELSLLLDTFSEATTQRACRLGLVVGEAGVGKSKLTATFLDASPPRRPYSTAAACPTETASPSGRSRRPRAAARGS